MIIVDAHEDIAFNALAFGRDYANPAYETRRLEAHLEDRARGLATFGLPDALLGRVAVTFPTLFVEPMHSTLGSAKMRYKDARGAYQLALNQMDYYQRFADESPRVRMIKTQRDLDMVLQTWEDDRDIQDHQQGWVILMENADPILEPRQFEEWYERGVRIVGPAWAGTRYSGGTGEPGPLTDLGRELLEVMASFNAVLDLSHMAEAAYFEALERFQGESVIASHSNPRRFRDTDRHLSDRMIEGLAERDGVMGIVLYNRFLSEDWSPGGRKAVVPFSRILDAIDYVCQITGSAAHVGIGSDFDGGFGAESIPEGIDTVTDLWQIGSGLRERGYSETDIAAILGGNMLRKVRQGLPT